MNSIYHEIGDLKRKLIEHFCLSPNQDRHSIENLIRRSNVCSKVFHRTHNWESSHRLVFKNTKVILSYYPI